MGPRLMQSSLLLNISLDNSEKASQGKRSLHHMLWFCRQKSFREMSPVIPLCTELVQIPFLPNLVFQTPRLTRHSGRKRFGCVVVEEKFVGEKPGKRAAATPWVLIREGAWGEEMAGPD